MPAEHVIDFVGKWVDATERRLLAVENVDNVLVIVHKAT